LRAEGSEQADRHRRSAVHRLKHDVDRRVDEEIDDIGEVAVDDVEDRCGMKQTTALRLPALFEVGSGSCAT
jgi:hypothetical protein